MDQTTLVIILLLLINNYYALKIEKLHRDIYRCIRDIYLFYVRSRTIPYIDTRIKQYRMAIITTYCVCSINYQLIKQLIE